jgi:hypothetical protein
MKSQLRRIAAPLLNIFERGDAPFHHKAQNRTVLLATSGLFIFLSFVAFWVALKQGQYTYLLPPIVFGIIGLVGLLIATLGNDRAVAKIWGNK